jgi:hypothetical protein
LPRGNANGDSQEHKGAKPAFGKQKPAFGKQKPAFGKQWRVNALMMRQTNRLVARQPVKAGRSAATMRASFTDRVERARMRISPSKGLTERIVQ